MTRSGVFQVMFMEEEEIGSSRGGYMNKGAVSNKGHQDVDKVLNRKLSNCFFHEYKR